MLSAMPQKLNVRMSSALLFLLILGLFFLSRTAFLDRDLPPGIISSYMQVDEMYYTIPAFNLFHYGEVNHPVVAFIDDKNVPVNVLENAVTFLSLSAFGNNYYGLRMASALSALLIYLLIYFILKRILDVSSSGVVGGRHYRWISGQHLLYFLMAYLLFDFSFMIAGRVAEPTIFRTLALMIVLIIGSWEHFDSPLESKWSSLGLGLLAMGAVVFVYIYNVFILFAMAASVCFWASRAGWQNILSQLAYFIAGCVLCLAGYQIFAHIAYQSSILDVYHILIPFQSRMGMGDSPTSAVNLYLTNLITLFMTNIFRFNMVLLFIFISSIPIFVRKVTEQRNNFDILVFNLILFLLLQSIVINDYPLRKLIILLPLMTIMLALCYSYWPRHLEYVRSIKNGQVRLVGYWVLAWSFTVIISAAYLNPDISGKVAFATGNLNYINWGIFLTTSLMAVGAARYKSGIRTIVAAGLLMILLPNVLLDFKYVFLDRTYYFRDTMIALSDKIDEKIVAGGIAYGFRLYNRSIPVLNVYATDYNYDQQQVETYHSNFDRLFSAHIAKYSIALVGEKTTAAASEEYMYAHGLRLVEAYGFADVIDGDVGLFSP